MEGAQKLEGTVSRLGVREIGRTGRRGVFICIMCRQLLPFSVLDGFGSLVIAC